MGWAMVDGRLVPLSEACVPADDPAVTTGWSVFETLVAHGDRPERIGEHLSRLARSAAAARIAMPATDLLEREVIEVARRVGEARVRVTLTGGGRRLVTATPLEQGRRHRPVRAIRGPHRDEPFLGGAVKHGSRAPWVVAVAASGVDEVLLVADDRFTEGTQAAILAVIDGEIWTAPHDGRILESTTCLALLERARALGIPVRREAPPARGPWDGLYVASVTRHLAPVVELDGEPLPGWEPVGRRLVADDDAAPV